VIILPFLEGTIPAQFCDMHGGTSSFPAGSGLVTAATLTDADTSFLDDIPRIRLDLDLLPELNTITNTNTNTQQRGTRAQPRSIPFNERQYPVNEPAIIPDTPVQYIPREDEEEEEAGYDNEHLPPWNQLD
jgi:hypothetical protein